MELPWLKPIADGWRARIDSDRLPHAVLLLGPAGTGKRATANWIVRRQLNIGPTNALPESPFERPVHADLHWVSPPEDGKSILIDQVRDLVAKLTLTPYEGGWKVAVIEPANAMTSNAANSLLKTLEEPRVATLLILVADRVGRLPATIFSRCQRVNFNRPDDAATLQWLNRFKPGADWAQALKAVGGAPLAAISALERLPETTAMAEDFVALAAHNDTPVAVAARWAKYEADFVLDWLVNQVQALINRRSGGCSGVPGQGVPESVLLRIDRRKLFCYLDIINRLRGQAAGSFNVQLTLESLLVEWAEGLVNLNPPGSTNNAKLSFLNR